MSKLSEIYTTDYQRVLELESEIGKLQFTLGQVEKYLNEYDQNKSDIAFEMAMLAIESYRNEGLVDALKKPAKVNL